MTLCRRDYPMIAAIIILAALFFLAAGARADPTALEQVAHAAAAQVAAPGWISLAGNLTVAGILWFYSRQFYTAMERKDSQLLELTKLLATLVANYENLVRSQRDEANLAKSQRINHNAG